MWTEGDVRHTSGGVDIRAEYLLGLVLVTLVARAEAPRILSSGVRLPGCQLAADAGFEFIDWNDDGKLDLFLEDPSMISGSVLRNEGSPAEPKFGHAMWYPLNLTEAEPYGMYFTQTRAVCDLNHDGLWDLLVYDGQPRMIYNTGTKHGPNHWNFTLPPPFFPGSPQMIKENTRFTVGMESMYWGKGVFPRQVLTLTVADWDGDGLEDLLICRFKDEAPGLAALPAQFELPTNPVARSTWMEKLSAAPARGLYFYKNVGTREKPWFDAGIEITTSDGQSIAAPNPVVMDIDGDGIPDLVSTETPYVCNAFRVDWPTRPNVVWFRRPANAEVANLEPARPMIDAAGTPIAAGVQARFADLRNAGVKDLFVLDPFTGLRWYRKSGNGYETPTVLPGMDFARFGFMYQPLVVDWFGPNSRDLILHGCYDPHCQWAIRRTALYRNRGGLQYEFVGFLNYAGDRAMVPQYSPFEERPYDVYGSYVAVMPDDGTGKKRLVLSVNGKLHLFTDLAADGLTFQTRKPVRFTYPESNRMKGWQEIPVNVTNKVQFIRINNERNGIGANRDSYLHIVTFEALAGGKNWAPGAAVYPAKNPTAMLTGGNASNFTTLAYAMGPAIVALPEPVALEQIRFQLSDREPGWSRMFRDFLWQGRPVRQHSELGELWFNYRVEVSVDQTNWVVVADRMKTPMMRSCPVFVDWNHTGKFDLVLGVLNANGIWPDNKEYRLYLNQGTNDDPKFADFQPLADETGKPLKIAAWWLKAYAPQCGVAVLNVNGKRGLVVEDAEPRGGLRYYENLSDDPLRFKFVKLLGDPVPIDYPSGYRYFYCGDVNGDGLPDVINCTGSMVFFPGLPAGVTNVMAVPAGAIVRTAEACCMDASKPDEPAPRNPSKLEVRTLMPRGQQKQRMILIRFTDLPQLTHWERATLELTTDPSVGRYPLQGPADCDISCSVIRADWDAEKATFAEAAPGQPWAPGELDAGGTFLSMAEAIHTVQPRQTVVWDVTRAVREAQQAGQPSISLLIRAEYTGKYVAGAGYSFYGPAASQVEFRPRLCLLNKL